ncbi:MAG: LysR substrate-binding domain-containing protein [Acinetobacter sp.]
MARQFDYLADVEIFLVVAERGSITAAAIQLSTTPSVVSRGLTRLEKKFGVQLLHRTTRKMSLTEIGKIYFEQMQHAFQLISQTEDLLQISQEQIRGTIKISAPTTYGQYRLPTLLKAFIESYPHINIELSISNRNVDLISEGFDLAIRQGKLPDSNLTARVLEYAPLRIVASPTYLEKYGTPTTLEELVTHRCIAFELPSDGRIISWLLQQDNDLFEWTPSANILVRDDIVGLITLAESDLGICQNYAFIVDEKIRLGLLTPILENYSGRTRPFSLIYAKHKHMSSATRALIDYLSL